MELINRFVAPNNVKVTVWFNKLRSAQTLKVFLYTDTDIAYNDLINACESLNISCAHNHNIMQLWEEGGIISIPDGSFLKYLIFLAHFYRIDEYLSEVAAKSTVAEFYGIVK